jgi:hypothetical protein
LHIGTKNYTVLDPKLRIPTKAITIPI